MFRFPLWLGLWGAVLPIVTLLEGIVPLVLLIPGPIRARDFEQLFEFWRASAKYGVPVGVVAGLIATGFCLLRHGRDGSTHARRFELNLRWCLLMALLLIAFNDAVFYVVAKTTGWISPRANIWVQLSPMILAGVFNLVAVVWGTTRTIATDNVLTPRVLMEKLRRSAKLTG